jgi:hypothetical protein
MLLSLVAWLGALIFFPVVAQTAFANLSPHSAGLVVRESLLKLHWMALVCGVIFFAASLVYNRTMLGVARILSGSHLLVATMLALTAISQFHILPRMDALRLSAGEISTLPSSNPIRAKFDSLHACSTHIEGTVLLLGLVVLYLTSRRLSERS